MARTESTAEPTTPKAAETPQAGGSYVENADGTLTPLAQPKAAETLVATYPKAKE